MSRGDRGDTLVEVLVAMGILGTAVATLLSGFSNLVVLSVQQRDRGAALTALAAASEYAKTRACTTTCAAEGGTANPVSLAAVPRAALDEPGVSISAAAASGCCGADLVEYVVTVVSGTTTYTNTVVLRRP